MVRETTKELEKRIKEEERFILERLKDGTLASFDMRDHVFQTVARDVSLKEESVKRVCFMHDVGIYHSTDNVLIRTAIGKKWSYQDQKEKGIFGYDYDYDASFMSSIIMRDIIFLDGTETEEEKEKKGKIKHAHGYEYAIFYEEGGESIKYRGDTMNSWSTTLNKYLLRFGGEDDGSFPTVEIRPEYKTKIPSYITHFLNVVYTIGNFFPLPDGCNKPRGGPPSKDYWDLALMSFFNYYHHPHETFSDKEISLYWLLKNDQHCTDKCNKCIQWLKIFGEGRDGWRRFVEKNFLQDFVTSNPGGGYGPPKELWDGHLKNYKKGRQMSRRKLTSEEKD